MINSDNLCMSCMKEIGTEKQCPYCGFHVDSQQSADYLPVRTVIGNRYLVGKLLEFNGDGATYMGFDLTAREAINIREYFPVGVAQRDPKTLTVSPAEGKDKIFSEYIQSFTELWRKLMRLNGLSALLKVNNIIEGGGTCYAITENIDGITLREHLLRNNSAGYIPWEKARPMLMPVLSTLGTLHNSGIVHRGISPSTLIVAPDGKIRITGFSINAVRSAHTDLKKEIFPGYAAFEQYGFEGRQGPGTDVYAFGAVLYRTLIGTDPIDAQERVANDKLMIPGKFAEQLPAYVINGLVNALQILPDDRIKTVDELRDELSASPNAVAAADKMDIDKIRKNQRVEQPARVTEAPEKRVEAQKKHNRNMTLIAIITILVIAVVAIGVCLTLLDSDSGNDTTTPSVIQEMVEVPSFLNKDFEDIMADKYYTSNFNIQKQESYNDKVEEGVVISQNIAPGTQIGQKSTIILTVSKGREYVSFPANGIVGVDYNEAKALLEKSGYKVTKVEKSNPGGYIEGTVYQSSLDSGEIYPKGSQVILTVWGAEPTTTTEPSTEPSTESGTMDDTGGFLQQILG
ncbi:MAG: PASTA domain-containing protein [Clostridia bacterium]|nr:PASTA domain-containing protein [Clostridia bacterium]